jgi:hypothetical protein
MYSSGYFSSDPSGLELAVSTGVKDENWLMVLVHESCHLDQWIEDRDAFEDMDKSASLDEWIGGKRYRKSSIDKAIEAIVKVELDCEKRSVEKIKKYNLPLDTKRYTCMANTYMYFYYWIKKSRIWVPKNKSLYIEEIIKHAPKRFQKDYSVIPLKLEEAFEKYLK